jgi:ferredoxin
MMAKVNPETCIGCGVCVDDCPDVFGLDGDGLAIANALRVPAEFKVKCREVASNCPVKAISIED